MNPDGTLNAAAGPTYAGLTMAAARKPSWPTWATRW